MIRGDPPIEKDAHEPGRDAATAFLEETTRRGLGVGRRLVVYAYGGQPGDSLPRCGLPRRHG